MCYILFLCLSFGPVSCKRNGLTSGPQLTSGGIDTGPETDPVIPAPTKAPVGSLTVNEVMLQNTKTHEDEEGDFPPWIEIYNSSEENLDLFEVPLTDELIKPNKWLIPDVPEARNVPPGGFLVIFLDEKNEGLHANFSIPVEGEFTLVVNKDNSKAFNYDASRIGPDEAAGRLPDGNSQIFVVSEATPGEANIGPAEDRFVRGDGTGNGIVTAADMILITRIVAGEEDPPLCQDRLDANDDGEVTEEDALLIGNELFGGDDVVNLPPPYPDAGLDPTPDELTCPRK
jgi:hypothetical protein